MNKHTTPLDREILTHYYTTPGPFPRDSPHISDQTQYFLDLELLTKDSDGDVVSNDAALQVYMDALGAVPLPVKKWVQP